MCGEPAAAVSGPTVLSAASFAIERAPPRRSRGAALLWRVLGNVDCGCPSLTDCVACALRCAVTVAPSPEPRGVFDSLRVPVISLEQYIRRLSASFACSDACLVGALVLLDRFLVVMNRQNAASGGNASAEADTQLALTELNAHRLFLTCYVVSAKYNEDLSYGIPHYAKAGGIFARELSRMESALLRALDFDLFISPDQYRLYESTVQELALCGVSPKLSSTTRAATVEKFRRAVMRKVTAMARPTCCHSGLSGLSTLHCRVTYTLKRKGCSKRHKRDAFTAYAAMCHKLCVPK